jgi:hypothetical protein
LIESGQACRSPVQVLQLFHVVVHEGGPLTAGLSGALSSTNAGQGPTLSFVSLPLRVVLQLAHPIAANR